MKRLLWSASLVLVAVFLGYRIDNLTEAFAGPVRPGLAKGLRIDFAVNNGSTTFGTGAGSQLASGLTGKSHICLVNTSDKNMALALNSSSCASGTTDDAYITAGGSFCPDVISINSSICARSITGAAPTSGDLMGTTW